MSGQSGRYGQRQQQMLGVIHARGGATVREIHARIPDPPPTICGLRAQLDRLVKRSVLRKRRSGRHSEVMYLPATACVEAQRGAFTRIIDDYFDGRAEIAIRSLMRLAAAEVRFAPRPGRRA